MTRVRDRWVAGAAVAVLVILSGVVVGLVLDAQRAGIETRESFRLEQVNQLAASLDTRVQQAYSALGSSHGAPGAWELVPNSPADRERLTPSNPRATAGALLVDLDGTILNGSLLRDPSVIGTTLEREGLDAVLAGAPALLPVAPGLTTTEPTFGIGIPARDAEGNLAGAYLLESPVATSSAFTEEVAELRAGDTGTFSFVDGTGTVIASSEPTTIGQRLTPGRQELEPGFHRVGDDVLAVAQVPAAGWKLVFEQSRDEFQGDLTGPLRGALVALLIAASIAGTLSVVALLRRLRTSREEQRRLRDMAAAREEFTSIVSHELRTPVAGLLGFLQTTVDHWPEMTDDERSLAVSRAFHNARRLQHLTSDVLDTASMESGELAYHRGTLDLRAVVEDAADAARLAHTGHRFEVDVPDGPVPVEGDATRLSQVVTNLLDNAVKSAPVDSTVALTVREEAGQAAVTVRDQGPGVAPDERDRIFDKFHRGRGQTTRGSGLGLYIARQVVSAHGGRIWVDEGDGAGAAIVFTLPTSAPDRAADAR